MLSQEKIEEIRQKINTGDDRLSLIFSVLSDARRLGMVRLFANNRDICVTDVARIFTISLPAASRQLRILEMAGLLRKEKIGKILCYEIKKDDSIVNLIIPLISPPRIPRSLLRG